jgi:poly-beta-1,6-N-acetyl-D-glucosamine synthase
MNSQNLTYILITPARNEKGFIEQTIQSVASQTVLPRKWIIVSDGSTDGTDEIVRRYLPDCPWMELVRMPEHRDRHFAAKVQCFNAGYEGVRLENADIIGNLDADITMGEDHFQFLLDKFNADQRLGVAGTPFVEETTSYDYRFTTVEHVSGACQLFRRECFEQIGGYVPVKGGGIDWIAVTTARMKGWKTRTFAERVCHHHRPMGTASSGRLRASFKLGQQDYYLGGHPVWQLFRACYQMSRKPYLFGGLLLLAGYGSAWITRKQRPVSPELIQFHQHEQMRRLRQGLFRTIGVAAAKEASN